MDETTGQPISWMDMQSRGVVGIVTDGFARDTDEIILQKTPDETVDWESAAEYYKDLL